MCTLISAQKQARDIYAQSQDCSPMFSHLYKNHFDDACSGLSFLSPTDTNETSQKDLWEFHVCLLESLRSDCISCMLFGRICISYRKQPRRIQCTIFLFFKTLKSLNFSTMLCAFCWHKNRVELNKYFLSCVPDLSEPLYVRRLSKFKKHLWEIMSAFFGLQKQDRKRQMLLAHICPLYREQSRREIYITLICSEKQKLKMAMTSRNVLSSAAGTNLTKKS